MNPNRRHKKNLIVSYKNLPEEVKELFKIAYPEGYRDYIKMTIKPNGEPMYSVPLETEDTVYMIKFDVKIDSGFDGDDGSGDAFDDDLGKDEGDFAPIEEALEKDEDMSSSHTERVLKHGAYEEEELGQHSKKKLSIDKSTKDELRAAFEDIDDFNEEEFNESYDDEEEDDDDDFEPTDDDLRDIDIDSDLFKDAEIPPEELAKAQGETAKPKRGRPRKGEIRVAPEPAAPKKRGRPRKDSK